MIHIEGRGHRWSGVYWRARQTCQTTYAEISQWKNGKCVFILGDNLFLEIAIDKYKLKWNEIVKNNSLSTIYDTYEWCKGLSLLSNDITCLPYFIKNDYDVLDIFPICIRKKWLINYLESLPYSDYGGGIIFKKRNKELIEALIKELIKIGIKHNCFRITIRRSYYDDLLSDSSNINYIVEPKNIRFTISLKDDVKTIFNNIHPNRRKNLKKIIKKKNIIIKEAKNENDLFTYYKIYYSNMMQKNYKPIKYDFIKYLWGVFKDKIKVTLAEYDGIEIAGTLRFLYNDVIFAWGAGYLKDYSKYRPLDLLNWHTLIWGVENNMKLFDFGGTPNDPSSQLYLYKNSWGGKKTTLYNYHIILQPYKWKLYRLLRNTRARWIIF